MDYTIFVDYNGSIDELDTDIRRGITQLLLEKFLEATSEFIKIRSKQSFQNGISRLTEYIAQGWSMADEGEELRDGMLTEHFPI